ncbi:orotidine-5'-phosphate decarboxylase [Candidatus Methylacidithermus pantelleriae]|uniref:Orotidine 5'-phosphate decarboxylase n=1 Tax=Candidatus Methylacidithermus pantelleriae TaxID=2744239 RepID=A0A8J2BVK8_9BACT|nr:orotidine-5'-phosphate decarboxylase [Candidatus Methylacidithermus pantelleriae]CAF0704420.1 Orotidine 5\\'-phosphate decarboxylase [Candidatus Methylacidithermus pantelleriae]
MGFPSLGTDRVIVALDLSDRERVLKLVELLSPYVRFFKVGSQLFTRYGPSIIHELRALGIEIFLDLKFHDIPRTVYEAVAAASELGIRWVSLHAAGGREMIRAGVQAVEGSFTQVLAVTVLTSLGQKEWEELGWAGTVENRVMAWARLASEAGVHGIICSPWELEGVRAVVGKDLWMVCPGIRDLGWEKGDQKRFCSAREAFERGATHIVIGRPILEADNPARVVEELTAHVLFPASGSGAEARLERGC